LFEGSYADFISKIGWDDNAVVEQQIEVKTKLTKKELRDARESIIKERSKDLRPLENQLKKTEDKIEAFETTIEAFNENLINAASDSSIDIAAVSAEHGQVSKELESILVSYEEIYEKVEELTNLFEVKLNELESN
jgi:thiamine kinase-like enzyme